MALYIGTEVVYITRMAHVLGQKCMHKQLSVSFTYGNLHIYNLRSISIVGAVNTFVCPYVAD